MTAENSGRTGRPLLFDQTSEQNEWGPYALTSFPSAFILLPPHLSAQLPSGTEATRAGVVYVLGNVCGYCVVRMGLATEGCGACSNFYILHKTLSFVTISGIPGQPEVFS